VKAGNCSRFTGGPQCIQDNTSGQSARRIGCCLEFIIQAVKGERGFVQEPYTDQQVAKILASVEKSVPFNLSIHQRDSFVPRIRLFTRLLLETGMDVSDAVQFDPAKMGRVHVGRRKVDVYRYLRQKTGVLAIVPVHPGFAIDVKNVPLESGCVATMPFRTQNLLLKPDQKSGAIGSRGSSMPLG
jgi:hypothetical protein